VINWMYICFKVYIQSLILVSLRQSKVKLNRKNRNKPWTLKLGPSHASPSLPTLRRRVAERVIWGTNWMKAPQMQSPINVEQQESGRVYLPHLTTNRRGTQRQQNQEASLPGSEKLSLNRPRGRHRTHGAKSPAGVQMDVKIRNSHDN